MIDQALQFAVSGVAIMGVILNNHRLRFCFILWIFSNLGTACFHISAGQWGLVFRDLVFLGLAVHGWFLWRRK